MDFQRLEGWVEEHRHPDFRTLGYSVQIRVTIGTDGLSTELDFALDRVRR
jgi:hypothetical protein